MSRVPLLVDALVDQQSPEGYPFVVGPWLNQNDDVIRENNARLEELVMMEGA